MIAPNSNVELTKVRFYDKTREESDIPVYTISNNRINSYGDNVIIKRNIFGHKWVLKVNETAGDVKDKSKLRMYLYFLVFLSLVVAVCFGVYLTIETRYLKDTVNLGIAVVSSIAKNFNNSADVFKLINHINGSRENEEVLENNLKTLEEETNKFKNKSETQEKTRIQKTCKECRSNEICFNLFENAAPKCVRVLDVKDPTGCGGLCKINKEFCKLLDEESKVYQCMNISRSLNCSKKHFNCGNRCITKEKRCDGVLHCSDFSDELNCECNETTHIHCGNITSCIHREKRCDGKVDCWDNSDEINCNDGCVEDEIPCFTGKCIPKQFFCDGTYQCPDKSDEPQGC